VALVEAGFGLLLWWGLLCGLLTTEVMVICAMLPWSGLLVVAVSRLVLETAMFRVSMLALGPVLAVSLGLLALLPIGVVVSELLFQLPLLKSVAHWTAMVYTSAPSARHSDVSHGGEGESTGGKPECAHTDGLSRDELADLENILKLEVPINKLLMEYSLDPLYCVDDQLQLLSSLRGPTNEEERKDIVFAASILVHAAGQH
jgi:hypothetical protein